MPKYGYDNKEQLKQPLTVAVVSWNMANHIPSDQDVTEILKQQNVQNADVIIIATQEEPRNLKDTLAHKVQQQLGSDTQRATEHYDTFTTMPNGVGRVSLSVLAKQPISLAHQGRFHHRNGRCIPYANKGGLHAQLEVAGHRLNLAGVHLDSKHDSARIYETSQIVAGIEGIKAGEYINYNELASRSADIDILAGDLNYRDIFVSDNNHSNPFVYDGAFTRHFNLHGLSPSEVKSSAQYTFAGDEVKGVQGANSFVEDKARSVGASPKLHYCQGGTLDRVLTCVGQGNVNNHGLDIIEGTISSDHKPVVNVLALSGASLNPFSRTKAWVIAHIKSLASAELIDQIEQLQGDIDDKNYLAAVFNYYIHIKQIAIEAEYERSLGHQSVSNALGFSDDGLAKKLANLGDQFFSSKQNLKDSSKYNQFQQEVRNEIKDVKAQTPSLTVSITDQIANFFVCVVTLGQYSIASVKRDKIRKEKLNNAASVITHAGLFRKRSSPQNPQWKSSLACMAYRGR